ncbi:MAG: basic amino acid/polyamine antiporter, family [Thermoplasmata archaeon]|nr:basic amino acid/polyamine antiporter, family [Thermoplasmata archaeon]
MTALGVSMMLGSGIFFGPSLTAREFPDARVVIALWLAGGLVALAGAWVFGRLAARRPLSGGPYVYLRDAYGELPAYLYAWTSLVIIAPTSMAVIAALLASNASQFVRVGPVGLAMTGAWFILLFAFVNLLGVKAGGRLQTALSAFKVLLVVGFLVALVAGLPASTLAPAAEGPGRWSLAFVGILFAYGGWEYAVLASEEVRDAARNVPRGLMLGAVVVTLLHVGAVLVYLRALGAPGMAAATALAPEAAARVSPALAKLVAVAVAVSAAGTLNAILLLGPRATFALARDGMLPRILADLSPRAGVPWAAIALQVVLAVAYLLAGGMSRVAATTVVGTGVFIVLSALALLRDRSRGWVGLAEIAAVVIVAGTYTWFLVLLVRDDMTTALLGLGLIAAGAIPYAIARARQRRAVPEEAPADA